ncbi:hypothetical protein ACFUC1_12400 [Pedococcus sp. NPDC057267]|uniref:hypothetical protein n=1 Tax=Pedococcus sp. NPDC057267 TaxID=3346077 RepID=UPI00362E247C
MAQTRSDEMATETVAVVSGMIETLSAGVVKLAPISKVRTFGIKNVEIPLEPIGRRAAAKFDSSVEPLFRSVDKKIAGPLTAAGSKKSTGGKALKAKSKKHRKALAADHIKVDGQKKR